MNTYHKNLMDLKRTGNISPVAFHCEATSRVAHLAQAVFVDLNKFKHSTS